MNDFSLRATSDDTRLTFHGTLLSRARQNVEGITTTEVCIYQTSAGDYVVSLADLERSRVVNRFRCRLPEPAAG